MSCWVLCRHLDHALANRSLGRQALKTDHDFPTNGEADMCIKLHKHQSSLAKRFLHHSPPPISTSSL